MIGYSGYIHRLNISGCIDHGIRILRSLCTYQKYENGSLNQMLQQLVKKIPKFCRT